MFNKKDMMWFANLTCKELKEELKKRGVKGYYKMKKEQLQETLLNLLEQEREEEVVEDEFVESDFNEKMESYREKFKREAEERKRKTQQDKEEDDEIDRLLREFEEQEKREEARQQKWSEEHGGKQYSFSEDILESITEELFKGKLVIPVEGQEDKVNRMLKDLAKIYHPDKPSGDSKMMIFVNEIKNEFRKAN